MNTLRQDLIKMKLNKKKTFFSLWTVKREGNKNKQIQKTKGVPCPSLSVHNSGKSWFIKIENLGRILFFYCLSSGSLLLSKYEHGDYWNVYLILIEKVLFIEYITPLESKNFEMKTNKIVKIKKGFAKRSRKQLIRFDSSTPIRSTPRAHFFPILRVKGKM